MSNLELFLGDNIALFWVAVGIVALILEIALPGGFLLSFSASGFLIAGLFLCFEVPETFLGRMTAFAVMGVLLILPIRWTLRRAHIANKDINEY